jgi:hypothetical protein
MTLGGNGAQADVMPRHRAALAGPGALTAAERGRLLLRMSALVLEQADELARWRRWTWASRCAGPRRRAGAGALPGVLRGAADKVHGQTIPFANGYTAFTLREPHGVTGAHRALELPDADHRPQRGGGAGDGQCLRAQAGRRGLPDGALAFAASPSRPACRRVR